MEFLVFTFLCLVAGFALLRLIGWLGVLFTPDDK